ncbi:MULTISPECIES: hypothetical protein [Fibrobacter]|uniref:hypothetical protein n=1 Tax=Fibrobacter TaxID=832 RepID=UPI000B52317D|nr:MULTISPECIES: hypothetical protein [Fibrobacter]OWV18316.1 hypothetical protein B7990_07340 [Fibrobacter sp. UWB4]
MLKNLYLIVLPLLVLVACSSDNYATGTVDPNAGPGIAQGDKVSSSSVYDSSDSNSSLGSSSSVGEIFVVKYKSVVNKDEEMLSVSFECGISATYTIVEESKGNVEKNKGQIDVYSEEKGASASCTIGEKKYLSQFKLGRNNRMERSIKLENFGSGCDGLFEQFKNLCLLQNASDEFSGACDESGTLEAYCAYFDESAVFDTLLDDFTDESKVNCGESGVHIDSFGI